MNQTSMILQLCTDLYRRLTYVQKRLLFNIMRKYPDDADLCDRYVAELNATVGQLCVGRVRLSLATHAKT